VSKHYKFQAAFEKKEDFYKWDSDLDGADEVLVKKMVRALQRVGGKKEYDFLSAMMYVVCTNAVWIEFSRTGMEGHNKSVSQSQQVSS
jgi:hypothetical protein